MQNQKIQERLDNLETGFSQVLKIDYVEKRAESGSIKFRVRDKNISNLLLEKAFKKSKIDLNKLAEYSFFLDYKRELFGYDLYMQIYVKSN